MNASPPKYCRALVAKIAFIALGILSVPQSRAVEIIGNSIAANFANGAPINPGQPRAAGFTMPGQDYTLTDVVLRLSLYSGPSEAVISIYSDSSGFPGSSLATLVMRSIALDRSMPFCRSVCRRRYHLWGE